jgi:MFS family permease
MTRAETLATRMPATASHSSADSTSDHRRPWLPVLAAMFIIGWGGNQFTPLLVAYRQHSGYSTTAVDTFLGAYVVGLAPGLLIASALSDRHGRRPVLLAGMLASIAGSTALALGDAGSAAILIGRMLSGLAVGIALAVGSSWVKELSTPSFDPGADAGTGARRASIGLTLGLGIGPGVAGVLAQWAPWPLVLPYLVQIGLALPLLVLLWRRGVETRFDTSGQSLRQRLRVPAVAHRRFRWVILPMAPWIFGSAGVAYAIVPQLVDGKIGRWALLYATALTVSTLGTGVLVQPIARRLDSTSTARAVFISMVLMSTGLAAAALAAALRSPWLGFIVALLLGAAYGIAVVSGLLEIQRIAAPDELAGLSGVYYAISYIGFLLPATLAGLSHWLGYPTMLIGLTVLAVCCTATIGTAWSKHLPVNALSE